MIAHILVQPVKKANSKVKKNICPPSQDLRREKITGSAHELKEAKNSRAEALTEA
ncbi:MAG: hypothetical protein WD490_04155 [Opitutales bacterium]